MLHYFEGLKCKQMCDTEHVNCFVQKDISTSCPISSNKVYGWILSPYHTLKQNRHVPNAMQLKDFTF